MPAAKQLAQAFASEYCNGYQLVRGQLGSNQLDAKGAAQCRSERAVRPLALKAKG